MSKKYRYTTCRQVGGDDGFQYRVVCVPTGTQVDGCTRSEATYYRKKFENEARRARGDELIS